MSSHLHQTPFSENGRVDVLSRCVPDSPDGECAKRQCASSEAGRGVLERMCGEQVLNRREEIPTTKLTH